MVFFSTPSTSDPNEAFPYRQHRNFTSLVSPWPRCSYRQRSHHEVSCRRNCTITVCSTASDSKCAAFLNASGLLEALSSCAGDQQSPLLQFRHCMCLCGPSGQIAVHAERIVSNGILNVSAVFAQLTAGRPILYNGPPLPLKIAHFRGDLDANLMPGSLGQPESSTRTVGPTSIGWAVFAQLTTVTDQQRDW